MRHRFILLLAVLLVLPLSLRAQNSIDKMIEEHSTVGSATFTTAVERDPKTRRVEKVVKRFNVYGYNAKSFISKFQAEAKRHSNTTTTKKGDGVTTVFTTKTKTSDRIYMLKQDSERYCTDATITIIIKMK